VVCDVAIDPPAPLPHLVGLVAPPFTKAFAPCPYYGKCHMTRRHAIRQDFVAEAAAGRQGVRAASSQSQGTAGPPPGPPPASGSSPSTQYLVVVELARHWHYELEART
jgi:hypothetical protein